jgi:hypothetical protein
MSFLKPSLDGIGTGAGVAWPLFGILSSTLGLTAGSTVVLITGSIAALLFCLVSGTIFYLSQKNEDNEEKIIAAKFEKRKFGLNRLICDCLNNSLKCNLFSTLALDSQPSFAPKNIRFRQLLKDFLEPQPGRAEPPGSSPSLLIAIDLFITKLIYESADKRFPPRAKMAQTAFVAAVGTFGAIAGCMAGFVGLLSGLGLVAGFAATPLVGWATLLAALSISAYVAVNSVEQLIRRYKMRQKAIVAKEFIEDWASLYRELQGVSELKKPKEEPSRGNTPYPFFKLNLIQREADTLHPNPLPRSERYSSEPF